MATQTKAQTSRQRERHYSTGQYTTMPKCEHCGKGINVDGGAEYSSHPEHNAWGRGITLHKRCYAKVLALPVDKQRAAVSRYL